MSKLIDIINSNPMLKRLHNMLELGMNTYNLRILQQHLYSIELDCTIFTTDYLSQLREETIKDMSCTGYSNRDILEMDNVISIYGMTAVSVQKESVPSGDIDRSWAAKFYDCVKTISEKNLQPLWCKILANEMMKPGTYFKRTLDVFARADKFEIDWFFEATKFIYDKACVPEFILTENKYYPFNQFQTLIDAGFVNSSSGSIHYDQPFTLRFFGADMKIELLKPMFNITIYTLTDAGSQLFDLRPEKSTDSFLKSMKEMIEQNNFAKVISIDPIS